MSRVALRVAIALAVAAAIPALSVGTLEIAITSPARDRPVFGEVEVAVSVSSLEPVLKVDLFVDGRFVGSREKPPYRWSVDVGQENRPHRFEAHAEDAKGQLAQSVVETPPVGVDDRLEVSLQQVFVTASSNGVLVDDLDRSDFVVLDGGVEQELITFERGSVPLTALLALDASHSMRGDRLAVALASARSFVNDMQPLDQASLLLFADRILHVSPFTGFREILGTGLERVRAAGKTALADHLYVALKRLEGHHGRRVLILLSDGFDTTSVLSMREVGWLARRSQAMIYWLRLRDPDRRLLFSSAWHDNAEYRAELERLERTVAQSGGDTIFLADTSEAEVAFKEILRELRGQYVLGYYPSETVLDGSWREIRVRLARRGVKLRYRDGYLDH